VDRAPRTLSRHDARPVFLLSSFRSAIHHSAIGHAGLLCRRARSASSGELTGLRIGRRLSAFYARILRLPYKSIRVYHTSY
jgi:hypothetical protein